jgi:hypothetical protein
MFAETQLKDPTQRIDDVRSRLLARSALAIRAGDLRYRRNDAAVLAILEDDRYAQRLAHHTKLADHSGSPASNTTADKVPDLRRAGR